MPKIVPHSLGLRTPRPPVRLVLVLALAAALTGCNPFVIEDFPQRPLRVNLAVSALRVTTAGPLTLTADVAYSGGVGRPRPTVEFYDGATKVGEDDRPTTPLGSFIERYEHTVNLTSADNGMRSYTARAVFEDRSLTSEPVVVTVDIAP